jgi:aquaporin related protein
MLAAGFYKMLKWLQYETVLGPEDGPPPQPTSMAGTMGANGELAAPGKMIDEEKAIEGNNAGTMAVSGPGLGDLLTEPAMNGGVSSIY